VTIAVTNISRTKLHFLQTSFEMKHAVDCCCFCALITARLRVLMNDGGVSPAEEKRRSSVIFGSTNQVLPREVDDVVSR
jgi:hypothetical protein